MSNDSSNDDSVFAATGLDDEATEALLVEAFPGIESADPDDAIARMAERLLKAKSIEERFDALDGNSSDELIGKSFEINGVTWQLYPSERGNIPQAVVDATDLSTGEEVEWVTTAKMLVFFLRATELQGQFPFKTRIVEKTTKRGNKALNFERV